VSSQTIARRYAIALADVLRERENAAIVRAEIDGWAGMISDNRSLLEALANPTVAYDQKQKVLSELISRTNVTQTTANFLRLLLKNQRLAQLPDVNAKLAEVLDERSGVVSAHVTSARPVPENVKAALEQRLRDVTGKKARLSFETDESLLGGMVTRIGSTVYDGSVRNQLERLRDDMAG
jgi:F-type H+-transporting ATPase subunit delta